MMRATSAKLPANGNTALLDCHRNLTQQPTLHDLHHDRFEFLDAHSTTNDNE